MNNALEIKGLNKAFEGFSLRNVSFYLPEGYIMGFIGLNGAGKTSVIKLILNILKKDSGTIKVFGLDHENNEEKIKEQLGIVFEEPRYLDIWNLQTLEKAVSIFYKTWDSKKYYRYLSDFGLSSVKKIKDLSKGMKLKLMLAVALSHETRLLILDEPTSGLDPASRDELMDILTSYVLTEDKSILLSTHITADLERVADYITFMNQGEVAFTGTKDELLETWCLIKGDIADLPQEKVNSVVGLTKHQTWFEGMFPVKEVKGLSSRILTEPARLDDILLFSNKGGKCHG